MNRREVLDALERISCYSDKEVEINPNHIRNVADYAYCLIKQDTKLKEELAKCKRKQKQEQE